MCTLGQGAVDAAFAPAGDADVQQWFHDSPLALGTLVGQATDDADRQLTGRRETWFAVRRRLGHGARLATRLPAGTVRLRMVAVDSHGRRATATRTLHTTPPPLSLTKLRAASVKAGARRAGQRDADRAARLIREDRLRDEGDDHPQPDADHQRGPGMPGRRQRQAEAHQVTRTSVAA